LSNLFYPTKLQRSRKTSKKTNDLLEAGNYKNIKIGRRRLKIMEIKIRESNKAFEVVSLLTLDEEFLIRRHWD
jgi:hypothetical protein